MSWTYRLLLSCVFVWLSWCYGTTTQAEPVAQIPLSEFKVMLSNVDKLQKREKLQAELIGHLQEMNKLHTDYIAKMEAADEQREKYVEKLEVLANDPRWAQRAQDWATASGVTSAVLYLGRKLILKF